MVTASGSTAASAASAVSMEVATAASTALEASSAASEMSSASGSLAVKSTSASFTSGEASDGAKSDKAVAPFGSSLFKRFSSCVFLRSNTSRASCNPARLTLSAFVKPPSFCFCSRSSSWFVRSSHCATSSSNLMRFNVMTGLDDSRRAWMNCVVQACAQGKPISIIVARWGGSMSCSEVEARSRTGHFCEGRALRSVCARSYRYRLGLRPRFRNTSKDRNFKLQRFCGRARIQPHRLQLPRARPAPRAPG